MIDVRYVLAICANPSHIGTSRGMSSMFPMNGRPLGPGGYGSLVFLVEPRDVMYLVSATRETAAPTGTTKWKNVLKLSDMKLGAGWG